jgi:hypothetical protein
MQNSKMKMTLSRFLGAVTLILGAVTLALTPLTPTPVFAANPYVGGSGIFLAWEWANGRATGCISDAEITSNINWLQSHQMNQAFLNLTAVDSNGILGLGKYDCEHNYIRVANAIAPNLIVTGYLSGALSNVNDPNDWANIASAVQAQFDLGVDAVNVDFEPYRTDATSVANYKGLFAAIRNRVGSTKQLSLDYTTDPGYQWSAADYRAISAYFNVMMPMSYDSSCTTVACYQTILQNVWAAQSTNLSTGVQLMPILPAYKKSRYHNPSIENICTATSKLWSMLGAGQMTIQNVAVWWHYEWTSTDDGYWNSSCWLTH